jgi:tetratricopeptide (TPR) repeat protein
MLMFSSSTAAASSSKNYHRDPVGALDDVATRRNSSGSTHSSTMHSTSLLSSSQHHSLNEPLQTEVTSHDDLEKTSNECIVAAYDLVWHQAEYKQALILLHKALDIQRSFLGKHHKDVGYTCNFIATTYWLQDEDWNKAMRYFLEARRIFCKSMDGSIDSIICNNPLLRGIDDRIHCLLLRFQLPPEDVERAKQAIDRTIAHELQADRFKTQGLVRAARDEYKRARKVAGVLRQLI